MDYNYSINIYLLNYIIILTLFGLHTNNNIFNFINLFLKLDWHYFFILNIFFLIGIPPLATFYLKVYLLLIVIKKISIYTTIFLVSLYIINFIFYSIFFFIINYSLRSQRNFYIYIDTNRYKLFFFIIFLYLILSININVIIYYIKL